MFSRFLHQGRASNWWVRRNLWTVGIVRIANAVRSLVSTDSSAKVSLINPTYDKSQKRTRAEASRRLIAAAARISLTATWVIMRPLWRDGRLSRESSPASALYICLPLLRRTRVFFCEAISRANSSHRAFSPGPRNRAAHLAMLSGGSAIVSRVITHFLRARLPPAFSYRYRVSPRPNRPLAVSRGLAWRACNVQSHSRKMPAFMSSTSYGDEGTFVCVTTIDYRERAENHCVLGDITFATLCHVNAKHHIRQSFRVTFARSRRIYHWLEKKVVNSKIDSEFITSILVGKRCAVNGRYRNIPHVLMRWR